MVAMNRYRREDMLEDLELATRDHEWRLPVQTWICDCGCDIAVWCQRTSRGLAWTQQSWPPDVQPRVLVFETADEVERFIEGFARTPAASAPARLASMRKWLRAAWASGGN